jgi:hypothetical protein
MPMPVPSMSAPNYEAMLIGPRLAFAVVDFQVPVRMNAERADLGAKIADAFASSLKEEGAWKVVRKAVVLKESDLADPTRTRALREELGVDVVVGGRLIESGEYLTVESVLAENGRLLSTSKSDLGGNGPSQGIEFWAAKGTRQIEVTAFVLEIKGPAYLLPKASNKVVAINRALQDLQAGDRVRCGTGGELTIEINGVLFRIEPSEKWFTVDATSEPPRMLELLSGMSRTILTESELSYKVVVKR